MTYIHSFTPITQPYATRLIVGSMPGKASLAANQYYAHPRNAFWRITSELFGFSVKLDYTKRCDALTCHGIALWDTLKTCTRDSSLDSDIDEASIVPNDIAGLLETHPKIHTIFFNGAKAEQIYKRHILPQLPDNISKPATIRLPSTSPAHASLSYEEKLEKWSIIVEEGAAQ